MICFYESNNIERDRIYDLTRLDVRRCLYELLVSYKKNEYPEYFQDEAYDIFKRYNLID